MVDVRRVATAGMVGPAAAQHRAVRVARARLVKVVMVPLARDWSAVAAVVRAVTLQAKMDQMAFHRL